jgi:hypothetical protein
MHAVVVCCFQYVCSYAYKAWQYFFFDFQPSPDRASPRPYEKVIWATAFRAPRRRLYGLRGHAWFLAVGRLASASNLRPSSRTSTSSAPAACRRLFYLVPGPPHACWPEHHCLPELQAPRLPSHRPEPHGIGCCHSLLSSQSTNSDDEKCTR